VAAATYTNATLTVGSDGRLTAAANGASPPAPVRQSVLTGAQDVNGLANYIAAGAGLTATLLATASPVGLSFAAGFNAAGGVDQLTQVAADQVNAFAALPANNLSFLTVDRNPGSGALTYGSKLAPPQYGAAYARARQGVLQFGGAAGSTVFLDDFGNTWTAVGGAKVQSNFFKFGTGALGGAGGGNALNGAADYIKSTDITTLGAGGWALRGWINPSTLPGAGAIVLLCSTAGAAGFGVELGIYNNAGTIKFTYDLSSTNASNDIASLVQGTTTPAVGTWYFVELTFDAVAGVYRLYVNGAQEASTASALKVAATPAGLAVGSRTSGAAFFNGYIDKFEFLPYCQHPAGTAYAAPVAAPNVAAAGYAADWFDIANMVLRQVSGASAVAATPPAFTALQRLYVGEATTSGAAVTGAVSYALQGRYTSDDFTFAFTTTTNKNHNIGTVPKTARAFLVNLLAENGAVPGDVFAIEANYDGTNGRNCTVFLDRKAARVAWSGLGLFVNPLNGTIAGITVANWRTRLELNRGW
jgi:hypothetical protein